MIPRISSGNKDLDLILGGGFLSQSILLIGGSTGTGKSTLAHQILYANLKKESKVVYLTVMGKPVHKLLRNMEQYEFFKADDLIRCMTYEDVGESLEREGLKKILDYTFQLMSQYSPNFLCIDGIQRLHSVSRSESDYLGFLYEFVGLLSASPCMTLWLGTFNEAALSISPEAAMADHIVYLSSTSQGARNLKVLKLAQTQSLGEEYTYSITNRGLRIDSAKFAKRPALGGDTSSLTST